MTDFIEELNKKSVDTTSSIETRKCVKQENVMLLQFLVN